MKNHAKITTLDPNKPADRAKLREIALDLKAEIVELKEDLHKARANSEGLLTADQVLAKIFPDKASRPSNRWLRRLAAKGDVPSVRLTSGKTSPHFFRLSEVIDALNRGEDFGSMTRSELWERYEKMLTDRGPTAAREFFKNHIEGRA